MPGLQIFKHIIYLFIIYIYTKHGKKLPLVFTTFGFTLNGEAKTKGNFIPCFVFCSTHMVLNTLLYFVN